MYLLKLIRRPEFVLASAMLGIGCRSHQPWPQPPATLGSQTVDPFFMKQEENAEASDFVIYEHEFQGNTVRLNADGEDHLRSIADRLMQGQNYPVIVERSSMSKKEGTKYGLPVHNDPALDEERRAVISELLAGLNVPSANVVIAPALTPGFTEPEGERAFNTALSPRSSAGGLSGAGGISAGGGN